MADLIIFAILLVVTFITGTIIEKIHLKSLLKREAALPPVPVISFNKNDFPYEVTSVRMVEASVVIGADYFKTALSSLVNLFGGNISVLESVLSRGRREAVLRLKEKAGNVDFIANLRYETTELSEASGKELLKVEAFVYATAITVKKNAV